MDVRSIRYPGLISYKTEAGGGTTDYAVEIYYDAVKKNSYECFLKEDAMLPMLFMPDAMKATIDLMHADTSHLSVKSSYSIGAISFTPKDVAAEIQKHRPEFKITYKPDFRQAIAETWPRTLDASVATRDWGFTPSYGLEKMTEIMLREIEKKIFKK
jgi:nucleoside-diphosphate-sugar epimerase